MLIKTAEYKEDNSEEEGVLSSSSIDDSKKDIGIVPSEEKKFALRGRKQNPTSPDLVSFRFFLFVQ